MNKLDISELEMIDIEESIIDREIELKEADDTLFEHYKDKRITLDYAESLLRDPQLWNDYFAELRGDDRQDRQEDWYE